MDNDEAGASRGGFSSGSLKIAEVIEHVLRKKWLIENV